MESRQDHTTERGAAEKGERLGKKKRTTAVSKALRGPARRQPGSPLSYCIVVMYGVHYLHLARECVNPLGRLLHPKEIPLFKICSPPSESPPPVGGQHLRATSASLSSLVSPPPVKDDGWPVFQMLRLRSGTARLSVHRPRQSTAAPRCTTSAPPARRKASNSAR